MSTKGDRLFPETVPIFPLRNALLLPQGLLPLNIFEPRYLMMTDIALGDGRLIGMVRPRHEDSNFEVYPVGCIGRITSFMETDDSRYIITLTGMSRFQIVNELDTNTPYRIAKIDTSTFSQDLAEPPAEDETIRERLMTVLMTYLNENSLSADWDALNEAPTTTIVNSIASSCPFEPDEQQAMLEAHDAAARTETLISLMQMAIAEKKLDIADKPNKPDRLQ